MAVVGGGNSAGQAAVFLSQTARKVYMLVRSGKLSDTMSRYLIQRIEENPAIELHYKTEIVAHASRAHHRARSLKRNTWMGEMTEAKNVGAHAGKSLIELTRIESRYSDI